MKEIASVPDLPVEVVRVVERLRVGYDPERVVLFGSYARGTADRHSDLDLLIVKQTDERPLDRRVRVRRIAQTPDLRIPFSPLVYTPEELSARLEAGDAFVGTMLREGITLYER